MSIKIDRDKVGIKDLRRPSKVSEKSSTSFRSFVQVQKQDASAELFQAMIVEVEEQGKRLSRSRTVRDLQLYKRLIRTFLEKAVSYGLELSESRSWFDSNQPLQVIVKQIDERLMVLTDEVLKSGKEPIHILGTLDEIKGLLINLYR